MNSKYFPSLELIDIPLIRTAKNCDIKIVSIKDNVMYLNVDDESVRVEKLANQTISIRCSCKYCSAKGVAKGLFCRRKLGALFYLMKMGGRVSELDEGRK